VKLQRVRVTHRASLCFLHCQSIIPSPGIPVSPVLGGRQSFFGLSLAVSGKCFGHEVLACIGSAPRGFSRSTTGARHIRRNAFTTQIGGERFSIFRTSFSKSRLNFLSILRAGHQDYVFNDEALKWLRVQGPEHAIMEKLKNNTPTVFADRIAFLEHLASKGIDIFDRQLVRLLAEAGIWGAIRHHGLLGKTVIVSDDAGQFRVANHALCWVHAERLLQKLITHRG
jgi:hypothetical protein